MNKVLIITISLFAGANPVFSGTTADLFNAVTQGDTAQIEQILLKSPKLLSATTTCGWTLLHEAALCNQPITARMLINKRIDVDLVDDNCFSALDIAKLYADQPNRADINSLFLILAARNKDLTGVSTFLRHDARVSGETGILHGTTALYEASCIGAFNNSAATNKEDKTYELGLALPIISLLVDKGADPYSVYVGTGQSPYDHAVSLCEKGYPQMLDLFTKHKIYTIKQDIKAIGDRYPALV